MPLMKDVRKLILMTGNNILLDTNIVSAWLKDKHPFLFASKTVIRLTHKNVPFK
ncbi:hypothetical protein BDE36_3496 [Arcticibacter tournemirensis]|nr:hypothetical protein BDE36_3496 [Arcticibacter tournemirensis]